MLLLYYKLLIKKNYLQVRVKTVEYYILCRWLIIIVYLYMSISFTVDECACLCAWKLSTTYFKSIFCLNNSGKLLSKQVFKRSCRKQLLLWYRLNYNETLMNNDALKL